MISNVKERQKGDAQNAATIVRHYARQAMGLSESRSAIVQNEERNGGVLTLFRVYREFNGASVCAIGVNG